MRRSLLFLLLITGFLFSIGCKKDNATEIISSDTKINSGINSTEATESRPSSDLKRSNSDSNNNSANPKSLVGTSWQAFINVRESRDLYGYFIRYAEYHFEDSKMEFFANMVNAIQFNDYTVREDSVFFNPNNSEVFQFKILERGPDMMKVKSASGKENTIKRISESDLKLTRKERIKNAMEATQLFDKAQLDTQFESIKDIQIN